MFFKRFIVVIVILFNSLLSICQEDSLLKSLISADDSSKATIYNELADLYKDSIGNAGINFALNGIKYANQNSQIAEESYAYIMLGTCYLSKSDFQQALDAFFEAEELALRIEDNCKLQIVYTNIGIIYRYTDQIKLSSEYDNKALYNAFECADLSGIIQTYLSIGNSYTLQNKYSEGLLYFQKAVTEIENLDTLPSSLAGLYNNIGYIHFMMKHHNLAEESYNKAYIIFEEINNYYGMAICLNNIAEIKILYKDYNQAENCIIKADSLHKLNDFKESRKNLYYTTYQLYYQSGDYEKSIHYLNKYQELKDSIYDEKLDAEINKLKTKYEVDKLSIEAINQEFKIKQQNKLNIFLIVIISVIIMLLFVSIYFIIQKVKLNKSLFYKNKLLKLKDKEIHDNLNYARKIQISNMNNSGFSKNLTYWIFDLPKTIVGGDFYLTKQKNDKTYIILADATGHGVSGGFLSVISIQYLNSALEQYSNINDILNYLNDKFYKLLIESDSLKGESLAISIICIKNNIVEFASSKQKLWHYSLTKKQLTEYKGSSEVIGQKEGFTPESTSIFIEKNDIIFMSSDGFPDQFGEENKGKYKYSRFRELLRQISILETNHMKTKLKSEHTNWKGVEEQTDDILVIGIKF